MLPRLLGILETSLWPNHRQTQVCGTLSFDRSERTCQMDDRTMQTVVLGTAVEDLWPMKTGCPDQQAFLAKCEAATETEKTSQAPQSILGTVSCCISLTLVRHCQQGSLCFLLQTKSHCKSSLIVFAQLSIHLRNFFNSGSFYTVSDS